MRRIPGLPLWAVLALAASLLAGCGPDIAKRGGAAPLETGVSLHGHTITLHLSLPPVHPAAPLILFATGDGGWSGSGTDLFQQIAGWGYPTAGFDAGDYVNHLGDSPVRPSVVAADYLRLIHAADAALNLPPPTRVVLAGDSRGADLIVVAAAQPAVQRRLAGVLAIALTAEEEYVHVPAPDGSALAMFDTYGALPAIGPVPVAVVQSTNDSYVPAAEARRKFGPDSHVRRLIPIPSSDHDFDGGTDELYARMHACFQWIVTH
jgi:Bacterial virulence protein (VirJ)